MVKKNFLLLSLDDKKAKKIANVVNNDSCSKILDYLADKEVTEGDIVKDLNLPASTVNYNLKQLLDANLVVWEKSHYSEKGREVKHYSVANRYVIIAPKGSTKEDFLEKVKALFPAFLLSIFGTLGIYFYESLNHISSNQMAFSTVNEIQGISADTMMKAMPIVEESIPMMNQETSIALWFFLGAMFALIISFIWSYFKKR